MQGRISIWKNKDDFNFLDKLIAENHLLRKINKKVNFSFVNEITETLYCANNGRPSIAPELYFRMMLIKYLYDIKSIRQLISEVKYNISYRWFCGLSLKEKVPHHASFSRIKKRFTVDLFELFFLNILEQCKEMGLYEGKGVMVDSTLIQANASLNSMIPIKNDNCSESLSYSPGLIPPQKRNISNKTHLSATDKDATLAYKAGTLRSLKYKVHVCSDSGSRIIVGIKATTGAVHDSQPYLELINILRNKYKLIFIEVIADRAYGSGSIISKIQSMNLTSYIPLFSTRSGANGNTTTPGFTYDKNKNVYICSQKHILKPGKILPQDYVIYHSSSHICKNCPVQKTCLAPKKKNRDIRSITRHIHFDLFQNVKKQMKTPEFKKNLMNVCGNLKE